MSNASSDKPAKAVVPWNPWLAVFFLVFVYYASQVLSGILISLYALIRGWSESQTEQWLNASTNVEFIYILLVEALTLGAIYLFLRRYKLGFDAIGLKKPRWKDAAFGLIAVPVYFVMFIAVTLVVSYFVPGLNIDQEQQIGFDGVSGALQLTMTFIGLVVLPPITEEIMVRGMLYSSLKKALPIVWAVIITSALFAVAHLPEGGPEGPLYIAAIDTFLLSLVLIYLREKTGSLWASITLHAIKNGIAFVVLFVIGTR